MDGSLRESLEPLRLRMGTAVRGLLTDGSGDVSSFESPAGDPGLMGPDSVAWRVHADIATLIGGLRALLLQTMHPLAMAGVADHSDYRDDPWGRLHRTAGFLAVTTFGGTRAASDAVEMVRSVHDRVVGVAPDGRPYRANDPALLRWVHCTEVDSFVTAVERYGSTSLQPADVDRYLDEMSQIALMLGAEEVPTNRRELRAYWREVRAELAPTSEARSAARFLLAPPTPAWARPAYAVVTSAAVGMLPRFVRRGLRLPPIGIANGAAVAPAAHGMMAVLGWSLGSSPVVEAARRRVG